MLTYQDLETEMIRLSRLLDHGIEVLTGFAAEYAVAEDAYRLAKAKALLKSVGTVDEKRAIADIATSKERVRAYTLDGLRKAATEAVRSRRQQISAWQSLAAAFRAEAEYGRTGPHTGP